MLKVADIRALLAKRYEMEDFVIDKTGVKMVEVIGESFYADEPTIFCKPNKHYIERELQWYKSMSRFVDDIPGGAPEIWKQVADKNGKINSNYGWCIYSSENGDQYENCIIELKRNPFSRRAEMIYTRPTMHKDYNEFGRSDFICTDSVSYFIRDGFLHGHVKMRSNDAWAGYRNDFAWQKFVLDELSKELGVPPGKIIWSASSLHLYERQFYLLDYYLECGEYMLTKSEIDQKKFAKLESEM